MMQPCHAPKRNDFVPWRANGRIRVNRRSPMTETAPAEQVVTSPTYMADIRFFFRPDDIDHMASKGIDLGTYEGVKKNALTIYAHTAPPAGDMPPDVAGKWGPE